MKKRILGTLGLVLFTGTVTQSFAAPVTDLNWTVSVTMNVYPIDLTRDPSDGSIDWGVVAPNTDNPSNLAQGQPRLTLWNRGYVTIDYGVAVSVSSPSGTAWALGTSLGDTGLNRCVLAGIFTRPLNVGESDPPDPNYERDLIVADFGDEDVLGALTIYGDDVTPNVLARNDTGTDDDALFFKPYNCTSNNSTRSLRLLLQTPDYGSEGQEQQFVINITAQVSS